MPPETLGRPEIRAALHAGDWSTILQVLIRETGASQTEVATRVGISQPHVSRLVNGQSREPGIRTVRALCDGLGIPRSFAGLLDEQEDATDRRQFLAGAAGATGLAVIGTAAGHVPIESTDDERLLTVPSTTYRRLEQRLPSRSLIAPVSAHLALIRQLASRTDHSPAHHRRLFSILSETAGLAAWLDVDVDDRPSARRHYQLAVRAAERSGHPLLPAYMQASLAQFAAGCGDTRDSVRLVADARRRLPRSAPAIAGIWMDAVESLALAQAHDTSALAKLDHAETRLARAEYDEPVWPWIFRFDHQKLAGFRAQAAEKLGLVRAAEKALLVAAQSHQAAKPRAVTDVLRARVLARAGHLDEACSLAAAAFDVGIAYDSERVTRAVTEFRHSLVRPGRAADDLDDRLHSIYRENS
ncbi:helix-turn-helix domain-containing protein [Myceligenerans indicum]|uniref:Helix-turn-helix transcriptional regulator n=1 Tax=Myceligenerans indicum TaxID=2593663 RepID=A0ABS1LQF5_9MICO|nr:helix-turn-helix transcriptional regulator [Myceligenerans indicum]MBL0888492.1 helix-turn-helix transcriptional regulator [Myceligenerans indicum]